MNLKCFEQKVSSSNNKHKVKLSELSAELW